MSNGNGRFMYNGHAIGAAARFHRLDDLENLDHVVPTLGSSVLPPNGGRLESRVEKPYRYEVDQPRKRCLLGVQSVYTMADGRYSNGNHETEVTAEITGLELVEKLRCDFLRMHMKSCHGAKSSPTVSTTGSRIEGLRLGNVKVEVALDDEPLLKSATDTQFRKHLEKAGRPATAFGKSWLSNIVREIRLDGSEVEKQSMSVDGNTIVWKGFGRIILGEIYVKAHERRLTLVRLEMGSDAGGPGSAGDGKTNGETGG
jgi:hypothetical protein